MQNGGFPTYNNIFHVSFSDFDVQKCGLLSCAAEATKTVHFFGNFERHWLVNFINIFTFLRNVLGAVFCRRNGLK